MSGERVMPANVFLFNAYKLVEDDLHSKGER
jgi:hypothetical protein